MLRKLRFKLLLKTDIHIKTLYIEKVDLFFLLFDHQTFLGS